MKRLFWIALLGTLLAPAIARAQEVVVYYHTDAIGSVRAMTDETGVVIHQYDFLPFGEAWLPPTNPDTRQFAGKERDRETGLDVDYFGARYHLPLAGRFTTVDPELNIQLSTLDPQRWNRTRMH
jgi:RHS repeat-associated protein